MLRKVASLSALCIAAALTAVLAAQPAHADGATVVGMPNAVATTAGGSVATCSASGFAEWFVYPEGDAAVKFGGSTTCTLPSGPMGPMSGTADLIPNGGSIPVATTSWPNAPNGRAGSSFTWYVTTPGSAFAIRYTTIITAPFPYTWNSIPPHCTKDPVLTAKITCTMITFFTVT